MKTRTHVAAFAFLALLQLSCASVEPMATMTGETISVRLRDGSEESAELLAVEDSSVLCFPAAGDRVRGTRAVKEFPAGSIERITVSGFRNESWWVGVLVFEVLPAVGLTVAAGSANADAGAVFVGAMIPAGLTSLLYAVSGLPTPTFEGPLSTEKLDELRKYARFGGRLTSSQKEQLLHMHERGTQ